jgi:hypothetical protein
MTSTPNLWATFVSTMLGLEVPILSSLPRHHNNPFMFTKCGCKKHCCLMMDFHGPVTTPAPALPTQVQPRCMIGW